MTQVVFPETGIICADHRTAERSFGPQAAPAPVRPERSSGRACRRQGALSRRRSARASCARCVACCLSARPFPIADESLQSGQSRVTCSRLFSSKGSSSSDRLVVDLRSSAPLPPGLEPDGWSGGRSRRSARVFSRPAMVSKPPERLRFEFGCEVEHPLGADAVTARDMLRSSQPFTTRHRKLMKELGDLVAFDVQERIIRSLASHDCHS